MSQHVSRGQVFQANLEPVEGSEQGLTRPVVIVSRNALNQHSPVVVIVPFTDAANKKRVYLTHVRVVPPTGGLTLESLAMCEQIRSISKTRLKKYLGTLDPATMTSINAAIKITLDLP